MENVIIRGRAALLQGGKGAFFQLAMISAAVALPAVCHLTGAPVTVLLPMHWPVIAAGLFCGWRAGLLAGAASPLISFALSGMPAAGYLPFMTLELAAYGFTAGFAVERLRFKPIMAVLCSVLAGRAVIIAAAVFLPPAGGLWPFIMAKLAPGVPAALAQVALLSMICNKESEKII